MDELRDLYNLYPVLREIDEKNNYIIKDKAIFKTLYHGEYISSAKGTCQGILFVISGSVKIHRINEEGEETNLYNIQEGELCHEALSCSLNYKSLNIIGKAIVDSKICIIPMDIVRNYLFKYPPFLEYMYKDIYDKFNIVIQKREEKIYESLQSRLIKLLISKKSKIIYGTHKDIAMEIDSSREVVSRNLKAIEKSGYVKIVRGKIILLKDLNDLLSKNVK